MIRKAKPYINNAEEIRSQFFHFYSKRPKLLKGSMDSEEDIPLQRMPENDIIIAKRRVCRITAKETFHGKTDAGGHYAGLYGPAGPETFG